MGPSLRRGSRAPRVRPSHHRAHTRNRKPYGARPRIRAALALALETTSRFCGEQCGDEGPQIEARHAGLLVQGGSPRSGNRTHEEFLATEEADQLMTDRKTVRSPL